MSDTDSYKLSFDYRMEYSVVEQSDYLYREQIFVSRDPNEAFRELLSMDGDYSRALVLQLKDPEGKILFSRELAQIGATHNWRIDDESGN